VIAAVALVIGPLVALGHALGLDRREVHFATLAPFTWIRSAVLLIAAILFRLEPEEDRIGFEDFDLSASAMGISIGSGVVVGFVVTPGIILDSPAAAALVGLVRAVSETTFFRAYFMRSLDRGLGGRASGVAIVAALHAIYSFAVCGLAEPATFEGLVRFGLFAIATSLGYALLQKKTESVTAPFVCQVTLTIAQLVASAY
jgi:CAAX prenyl protease-like protein